MTHIIFTIGTVYADTGSVLTNLGKSKLLSLFRENYFGLRNKFLTGPYLDLITYFFFQIKGFSQYPDFPPEA